eukprot:8687705-Alexandrium_andersonii.AAC.1
MFLPWPPQLCGASLGDLPLLQQGQEKTDRVTETETETERERQTTIQITRQRDTETEHLRL